MAVEKARADLAQLERRAEQLQAELDDVNEHINKLRIFLALADVYVADQEKPQTSERENPANGRTPRGRSGQALGASIQLIRETGKPVITRVLLEKLAERGIHIGGVKPVANLASILSKSPLLVSSRTEGWSLAEWAEGSAAPGDSDRSSEAGVG
jgi:hypothetical protein